MFWNDIKEIKSWMVSMSNRMDGIEISVGSDNVLDFRKYEDAGVNQEALNRMINELKGCVSQARASLKEPRDFHSKLSYICENIDKIAEYMQKCEKKSPKKKKVVKNKVSKKAIKKKSQKEKKMMTVDVQVSPAPLF